MPKAPCPAQGTSCGSAVRMRAPRPRRLSPAAASTMASNCPSSSFRSRVCKFPRRGSSFKSGLSARSCACRRKLLVPTTAPRGNSWSEAKRGLTNASAGSSRSSTAASTKPSGKSIGTSLSECTAKSACPCSSANSSSFTKRPLPPILDRLRSSTSSPRVESGKRRTVAPSSSRSRVATCSACHRASGLWRVAIVNSICMPPL